jgi:hypothetical protein
VRAFDLALTIRKRTNFPSQWSSTRTHRERAVRDIKELSDIARAKPSQQDAGTNRPATETLPKW